MGSQSQFRVLQVSNISPTATKDEVYELFQYIGRIDECKLYPSDGSTTQTKPKFAYIKFEKEKAVELGQHLTNVVFIDRALICVPAMSNTIPDEETAMQSGGLALPGQRQLPPSVTNQEQDVGDGQKMIFTTDPTLSSLGLPQYPPLPSCTEASKIEEIRRTVYIGNLDKNYDGDELMAFINATIGEVMYLRMAAGNDSLPCGYAYVEFSNQSSVPLALQNNGIDFNGRALRIQHSRVAIIKPQRKTADQALEEVEEAIKISEGKSTLAHTKSSVSPRRRHSPSPRRRSRDRDERRRTRSPRRKRSRSRKRSKSKERRSRSKESNSRSKVRRSKSRERDRKERKSSKERSRKSKSRERDRERKSKSRDRKSKSRERERKSKSKERDRRSKRSRSRERRREKEREREREKEKEREKEREREKEKEREREKERDRKERERKERDRDRRKRSRSKSPKRSRREKEKEKDRKKSRHDSSYEETPKKEKPPASNPSSSEDDEAETPSSRRTSSTTVVQSKHKILKEEFMDDEDDSDDLSYRRNGKKMADNSASKLESEEEILRERLLERVKRKTNGSDDNGTESLLANFKPEPMDIDD